MKHTKIMFLSIAFVALFFTKATYLNAQTLNETWFKLDISTKGALVDMNNETVSKKKIKTIAYMFVQQQEKDEGSFHIFCEIEPEIWIETTDISSHLTCPTQNDIFVHHIDPIVLTPQGNRLFIDLSGQFKIKQNKDGSLKDISFSSLGAYVHLGMNKDDDLIFGGVNIKGKLIDEQELPFTVPQ